MFGLGWQELLVVLIIALVIFGPRRLPEIGKALGKSLRDFKSAVSGVQDAGKAMLEEEVRKSSRPENQDEPAGKSSRPEDQDRPAGND